MNPQKSNFIFSLPQSSETRFSGLNYLFCLYVTLSFCAPRLGALSNLAAFDKVTSYFFFFFSLVVCAQAFFINRRATSGVLIVSLLALATTYARIFSPQMSFTVPARDWLYGITVSSGYIWSQAKIYVWHLTFSILAGLCLAHSFTAGSVSSRKILVNTTIFSVGLNVLITLAQKYFSMQLLTAGSGSSITSERPPGLLEDSGANSILLSAIFAGVIFQAIKTPRRESKYSTQVMLAVAALILIAGIASGGRIFYVIALTSVVTLLAGKLSALLMRGNLTIKTGIKFLVALVVVISVAYLFQDRLLGSRASNVSYLLRGLEGTPQIGDTFWQIAVKVDPVRVIHARTMWLAFLDRPFFGQGLATFYSSLEIFRSQAHVSGAFYFADPATNFYLMLLSELGVIGIVIGCLLAACTLLMLKNDPDSSIYRCFFAGISLAISIAFLVGSHIVFESFTCLFSFECAAFFYYLGKKYGTRQKLFFQAPIAIVVTLFLVNFIYLASHPADPITFRWQERGKPQKPLSLVIPIATHGHSGRWIPDGASELLEQSMLSFFIERPSNLYPFAITTTIQNHSGEILESMTEEIKIPDSGDIGQFRSLLVSPKVWDVCNNPTPVRYCTWESRMSPPWRFSKSKVGVFLIEPQ